MRQIEIDDDVWTHLNRLALPFVDHTPNDVLRRILSSLPGRRSARAKGSLMTDRGGSSNRAIGRREGRVARENYVFAVQQDVYVDGAGRVWGRVRGNGRSVAILFSSEHSGDRWFFGVKEAQVKDNDGAFVVLLCAQDDGADLDFVLPPTFISEVLPKLSHSRDQVKFNLNRRDNRYWLKVPYGESLDVTEYLKARWLLK